MNLKLFKNNSKECVPRYQQSTISPFSSSYRRDELLSFFAKCLAHLAKTVMSKTDQSNVAKGFKKLYSKECVNNLEKIDYCYQKKMEDNQKNLPTVAFLD